MRCNLMRSSFPTTQIFAALGIQIQLSLFMISIVAAPGVNIRYSYPGKLFFISAKFDSSSCRRRLRAFAPSLSARGTYGRDFSRDFLTRVLFFCRRCLSPPPYASDVSPSSSAFFLTSFCRTSACFLDARVGVLAGSPPSRLPK